MMKIKFLENNAEKYGIDLSAIARNQLASGMRIDQFLMSRELFGESYADEICRIIGNAPRNLLVRCSLSESELKEIKLQELHMNVEEEMRELFRQDHHIDLDFLASVSKISRSHFLESKYYAKLYFLYSEMENQSTFEKMEIIKHFGKLFSFCLDHGMNINKVLFHGQSRTENIYDLIMQIHLRLFFFRGINHNDEVKNIMLNEFMCERVFRPERTALLNMLRVIPWKREKNFFRQLSYIEDNLQIQLLDDLGEIMVTGHKLDNCLTEIKSAIEYLKNNIQLVLMKRDGAITLATLILKDNIIYLGMAYSKGNAKAFKINCRQFCNLIKRIVKCEDLPYEVHTLSFIHGGLDTNEIDEVDYLLQSLPIFRKGIYEDE